MRIAVSDEDVEEYIGMINQIAQEHPILVDKYLMGKEIEVMLYAMVRISLFLVLWSILSVQESIPVTVFPYIRQDHQRESKRDNCRIHQTSCKSTSCTGMINIQFIVLGDDVYVIEVNPRSSRTVPYISKVTGIRSYLWQPR